MTINVTLNKQDLIKQLVGTGAGSSAVQTRAALDAVLDAISSALLAAGDTVHIRGFGRFEVRQRAARTYADPTRAGKKVKRPAVNYIHFKATPNAARR